MATPKATGQFEVWTVDCSNGRATHKVGAVDSWALANFLARLASLAAGCSMIVDSVSPVVVASYTLGRLTHLYATAPGPPSIWP